MPDMAAPWIKWRWPTKKITIIGTISHMLAAIVMCHEASFGLMQFSFGLSASYGLGS